MAVRYAVADSTVALSLALFINAAILIVAAATFHRLGRTDVAEIQQAYQLLTPLLGVTGASAVFAFRSEEHTSELQSRRDLVCRLLLEKKKDYSHCRRAPLPPEALQTQKISQ